MTIFAVTPIFAQSQEELKGKFDEAESRIVRLQPTAFPELSDNVVRDLVPGESVAQERLDVVQRDARAVAPSTRTSSRRTRAHPPHRPLSPHQSRDRDCMVVATYTKANVWLLQPAQKSV